MKNLDIIYKAHKQPINKKTISIICSSVEV